MSKQKQAQLDKLREELKPGETLEVVGEFRVLPALLPFFLIAIISFVVGRVFSSSLLFLLVTNLVCVWMMADAARALVNIQNSCVLVTDRRAFGLAAGKRFDLTHHQIRQIHAHRGLFLDAGEARSSVVLRHLCNQKTVLQTLEQHRKKK
ncbi:MAG: hypothetical protein Q3Y08_04665 [Butyricicoccus sp.]|nr:hypothetical protein [Butyricicoccus sp.]